MINKYLQIIIVLLLVANATFAGNKISQILKVPVDVVEKALEE